MASRSVASTAERLAGIVEAAEQAASKVIDDAEEQARQRLDDAQMEADRLVTERLASLTELTDSLAGQAEEIGRQSDRLLATLVEVRDQVGSRREGDRLGRPQPAAGPLRGPHLSAVAPVGEDFSEISEPPRTAAHGGSAGARLLATQMAVSGSSRKEIESRLRGGFEIEDTGSILDAILGPED